MKQIILFSSLLSISIITYGQKLTDPVPGPDSVSQHFIETNMIERINNYRIEKGVHPLVFEPELKPAVLHHVNYMRLTKTMSHDEEIEVEGFELLPWPGHRKNKYLDPMKYWKVGECLLSDLVQFNVDSSPEWVPDGMFNFDYVIDHAVEGFHSSPSHWACLMNKEWDCIYIYYDLNYHDPNDSGAAIICTVMVGMYSDYFKEGIYTE